MKLRKTRHSKCTGSKDKLRLLVTVEEIWVCLRWIARRQKRTYPLHSIITILMRKSICLGTY